MLQILSMADRVKIHGTAKRILNEIGIRVRNKTIYDLILDAGGVPDKNDDLRIYFTDKFIDRWFSLCPKDFTITNRKDEPSVIKNGGSSLFYTSNATHYVRGTGRKAVEISSDEYIDFIRVVDSLENVHGTIGTSLKDYPPNCRDFAGFRLAAQYSYKHLRPCIYTPSGAVAILEMADSILDGGSLRENMFFTLGYSIVSPLTWSETALDLFDKTKGYGIPVMINSEPMAGGTSPVTLAGSLAMADAEVISGIIINQILEPGRPCIYNSGFAHVFDMQTAIVLTGSPENALLQAGGAEMAQFHNLPSASWALSDSAMLDSQASYEKLLTALSHILSGVNMVWGIGNIETSKTISPEVAVIDNEMIGNCLRFASGILVDEEHLAYNVIRDVVFRSSFLDTEHTFNHFRDEIRYSSFPNRTSRDRWNDTGAKSVEEKAVDYVEDILGRKPEIYLSGKQMEKLEKIQNSWMKRLNG